TGLVALQVDDGKVSAAVIRDESGNDATITVARGVVLATGGFSRNAQWRRRLLPAGDLGLSMAAQGCTGDGLSSAVAVGAVVEDSSDEQGAWWAPASVYKAGEELPQLFVHVHDDFSRPGLVAVDLHGKRFAS